MYAVALGLAVARAEEPAPARLCAEAAAGTEVEVCLRLAVDHPEAVYEIGHALRAHLDRGEAEGRDLLDALLVLSGPNGVEATQRLADLRDPRAVPALLHAVLHREPAVAAASATALVTWPETWPALGRWLSDPAVHLDVRIAAVRALAATADPGAAAVVEDAMRRPGLPMTLRREAAEALAAAFPGRPEARGAVSADGSFWLATGAGAGLGYAMAAAGSFGQTDLWPIGAITGGAAGASFGWVYGRAWPMEAGDASLIATAGASGAGVGALLGAGISEDPGAPVVGGLVGEAVGFGTGLALRRAHPGSATDVLEGASFAALTALASNQVLTAVTESGAPARSLGTAATLGAATVLGTAVAPHWDVEPADAGLMGTTAGLGLGLGLLLPIPADDRIPISLAAASGGAAVGLLLAEPLDVGPDVWAAGATGAVAGAAVGGGLGLITSDNDSLRRTVAVLGGTAGLGLGAWGGHVVTDPIDDRDVVLAAASTAWAAAEATAIGTALDMDPEPLAGGILVASGVAAATTASLNIALDVPVPKTLSASSLGLWGAYTGGAIGELAGADPRWTGVAGANLGLVSGGVLVSDLVGVPPLVIGIADAGGVLGASSSGLVASWFAGKADPVLAASLGGAVAGATAGAALGTVWHRSGTRRDIAFTAPNLPGRWSVAPMANGLILRVDQW